MPNSDAPLNLAASLTAPTNMHARIKGYLHGRSGISLFEMCRDIPGFAGAVDWFIRDTNVLIWSGMSEEACKAMMGLIVDGSITPTITDPLVYAIDGGVIDLPFGDELTVYETPHWVPHVFAGEAN